MYTLVIALTVAGLSYFSLDVKGVQDSTTTFVTETLEQCEAVREDYVTSPSASLFEVRTDCTLVEAE